MKNKITGSQHRVASSRFRVFRDSNKSWTKTGVRRAAGAISVGVTLAALLLSACTGPAEHAINTNVPLQSAPELSGAATPGVQIWRSPDLASYERVVSTYYIPPVTVYHGRGSSFANLSPDQLDQIAQAMTREVRRAIGQHFKVVDAAGPNTFTLNLSLVVIDPPHQEYLTNGPYPWSQTTLGMPSGEPMSEGRMVVAGKFIDSASGKLLVGFVAPVTPQMMDAEPSSTPTGTYDFAQAASRQFASNLVDAIIRQRQIGHVSATK